MNDAILAFGRELYREHFEEVSFLYESRAADLSNDELQWHELQDAEERMEAHLDALVIGGQLAINAMLELCSEGDSKAFYVVTCLFCRQNDLQGLFRFFATLDTGNPEILNAVRDGLIQDWPDHWFPSMVNYPFADFPHLLALFLPLYANRRQQMDHRLYSMAIDKKLLLPSVHCKSIRHLGGSHLLSHSHWVVSAEEDSELVQEKALCLLPLTNAYRELDYFQKRLPDEKVPFAAIVIAADEQLARHIGQPKDKMTAARLIAMGLTGLRDFIVPLLEFLRDDALAPTAAVALHTITGAGLLSEQFVEDEWSEDELFADELKAFREGKLPRHPSGEPYGSKVQALSTDPEAWRQWLREHATRFQPGIRYRLGYPVSPRTLVYTLGHPLSTRLVRYLTYEELAFRYGATIAFNPEDWVVKQMRAIGELNQWAKAVERNFQPGGWQLPDRSEMTGLLKAVPQGAC